MTSPHELKGLQVQLEKARAEQSLTKTEIAGLQQKERQAAATIRTLEERIKQVQLASAEPIVSEHAMLRWLQRVDGVDLEKVKMAILDEKTKSSIKFAQNGRIVKHGVTLIFKNSTIVTVE